MSTCNDMQVKLSDRMSVLVSKLSDESKLLATEIQGKAKELDPDLNTSGPDVWIGMDIDISWRRVDFSLDLPEVRMVEQDWSLDLPQVTMKNQDVIFHTPSVRMVTVKTGQYPETFCELVLKDVGFGVKLELPECTVRMSDMFADLPEFFMEEQRIFMGIPEFVMGRTEFTLSIPEFSLQTQKLALDIPEITIKNISLESEEAKENGLLLSREANIKAAALKQHFKENAKVELAVDVNSLFDCYQSELMTKKNEAMAQFDSGINLIQSTVTAMAANKVPDENPSLVQVKKSLADLHAKREEFTNVIKVKFLELGEQQKVFFAKLIG